MTLHYACERCEEQVNEEQVAQQAYLSCPVCRGTLLVTMDCGHSNCVQNYIETGDETCIQYEMEADLALIDVEIAIAAATKACPERCSECSEPVTIMTYDFIYNRCNSCGIKARVAKTPQRKTP